MNKTLKRNLVAMSLLGLLLAITACIHNPHIRGSVVLKHSATEADVCLGSDEVKPGDKVTLFKSECRELPTAQDRNRSVCNKIMVGNGKIITNIDKHYSMMQVDPELTIDEGMIVEK